MKLVKSILGATAGIALFAGSALAADLPQRSPPPAPVAAVSALTWQGFYIGAQAGYSWGTTRTTLLGPNVSVSSKPNGGFGGLHAGYNVQNGNLVWGVEGDANFGSMSGTNLGGPGTFAASSKYTWVGTLRGRLGYSLGNTLLYATGGVAFASINYRAGPFGVTPIGGYKRSQIGGVFGVGAEYSFARNWSARLEYRYTQFGKRSGFLAPTFPAFQTSVRTRSHSVLLGLSYYFDSGRSSVVAKY